MSDAERFTHIKELLAAATPGQLAVLERILEELQKPSTFQRNPKSDFVNDCLLNGLGDVLRIHHCFSAEAFTKDRFEYALERVANECGVKAARAPRGNPGHDLNIKGVPFSLKTQADRNIRVDRIHISKFMELGKGAWTDKESDLIGLRDQFFAHMKSYQRILTLRRLSEPGFQFYELVEIPKALLEEAAKGKLEMHHGSSQMPKPGYCTITDAAGATKFQLYFDGGTERKLQVRTLDKSLCIVHATWKFPAAAEPATL